MATLTITAKGQVTFNKEVLRHLGLKPGDKVELELLSEGRANIKALPPKNTFESLQGFLKGKTNGRVLSVEEMNDVIREASAEAGATPA
ncbi:transcriptional regulator [Pokkaliibacter sp. MBI-7]|uniref:AbrB/MazE/SpoVT family DNA-binding domain-containing protein n=1 Tax=Pokkaliibacter sp. MBI-7 TaxID=3040600 RepID=UPI00244AB732|nr:transcriptional regulator [Pokkaliibacter sp. MBI-7]MDH2430943.1 transcriptional regulator [Pokkaliibacter sp. MBI-7]MDH2431041.1 transcriptional regulator [Pokkaliibacter sp. MBI-7]MDH2434725.1 transcriptional regulator [Pokkaliibacter sp. MBI-7]MDH2434764.1 transcriptional regulator [Pokkaliibacter sp. MBI-7]MDH2436680.1 transcriptional regulator [Pokkaliibacter sp. MBI-7]